MPKAVNVRVTDAELEPNTKDGQFDENCLKNHINKTITYEDPGKDLEEEPPPMPREVELLRDPQLGFGFVAGSEKPVIVRFVKEGGPSENLLQAGDQILKINGEDVSRAPRQRVIELVKSCRHCVSLTVCQPHSNNSSRKSALLTAAKKAKLKNNPTRVRFAEGVMIHGSPLFCPMSTFESWVPFMPNVLTVFLENGQTKTFKYDSSTTVQDVLNSLMEKLSIKCGEHFALVCEHIKAMRRNRLTLLNSKEHFAKIATRPGAHNLRCLFRVMFVPRDALDLLERDPISFEYLYSQCCNDVVQERFSPELKYEIALRLSALQLLQHSLDNNCMQSPNGKVNLKLIERECGLETFVPFSLLETMKRKELHKLLNHFLKLNQQLCPSGQKCLTSTQAKLNYLRIISELPSYGAKIFSLNIRDATIESGLLVSPKFGISHVNSMRNSLPISLAKIEDISYIKVTKNDEIFCCIEVQLRAIQNDRICQSLQSPLRFELEDRDAEEFVFMIRGYHKLYNMYENKPVDKELPVFWDISEEYCSDSVKRNLMFRLAPSYCGSHPVREAQRSHVRDGHPERRPNNVAVPSPRNMAPEVVRDYEPNQQKIESILNSNYSVDHNMNEKTESNGIDLPSLVSMEILESQAIDPNVRNEDIVKRVSEMNKIVADAEHYLAEEDINSETKQLTDKRESSEDSWDQRDQRDQNMRLKATDSLLLLSKINGSAGVGPNDKQNVRDVINGELSANESDSDSLMSPSDSQRTIDAIESLNALQSTANSVVTVNGTNIGRNRSTSFGLRSPDVHPSLSQAEQDLIDSLKQLRSAAQLKLLDDLCLDCDVIDLTAIPPPDTPDELELNGSAINFDGTEDPPTPYKGDIDFLHFTNDDSARVVAELDNLCDTLSELQSNASDRNSDLSQHLQYMPHDIDHFIESMTIRPPPPITDQMTTNEQYLSTFIIPPPPTSSPNQFKAQDDVIAKFWKATDDIKKICTNEDTSPHLFKREVHSSSSGESGYDSAFNATTASDWPVFSDNGSPKHSLPTVIEVSVSSESENYLNQRPKYNKKSDNNESSSCEDLHIIREMNDQMTDTNGLMSGTQSPSLSRSHSWGTLPTGSSTLPSSTKPPIPPCSPSIQEKRRQLGLKSSHSSLKKKSHHHHNGYHTLPHNVMSEPLVNGFGASEAVRQTTNEIFSQSQRDIDTMLARLEEVHNHKLTSSHQYFECTENDFLCAKEALVTESRHFVTASKLFVKCATEASPQLLEYLLECVTLLERMYTVGELVLLKMESQAEITCLVDRLKEVAASYAYTVDTVHKLHDNVCSPSTVSPYMALLMNHATSLATSLSALMRTLRAINI